MEHDNYFDKNTVYRLYRTVEELITPSISKKNISNYEIVFSDDLLPVRVFYPNKVSNIEKVIIFIPGMNKSSKYKYTSIFNKLSLEVDTTIIAIDYYSVENEVENNISNIVDYLYKELLRIGISKDNIILMSDSEGSNYSVNINNSINKEVLLYPLVDDKKITIKRKRLIINGELDSTKDIGKNLSEKIDNCTYKLIENATNGFLTSTDYDIIKDYIKEIKDFI